MKTLKYIREEIIPLSRKQNIVLLIIIACIFQFVLFYTPALADEAVSQAQAQETGLNSPYIDDTAALNTTPNPVVTKEMVVFDESNPDSSTIKVIASSTPVKVIRVDKHVITAYNSEVSQTDGDPCTTANGYNLCKNNKEDSIAANFLKFGTKVRIPDLFGDRVFVVRDRMSTKHADRVDVWMKNHSDAMQFGVKVAKIEVLE